jgi:hypothetical protein
MALLKSAPQQASRPPMRPERAGTDREVRTPLPGGEPEPRRSPTRRQAGVSGIQFQERRCSAVAPSPLALCLEQAPLERQLSPIPPWYREPVAESKIETRRPLNIHVGLQWLIIIGGKVVLVMRISFRTLTTCFVLAACSVSATSFDVSTEQRLNSGVVAGTTTANEVVMAASGQRLYVAWTDDRHGETDIYFRRSSDAGVSWDGELRLDSGVAGSERSAMPAIAASGEAVYVVWQDDRNGLADIYLNRSTDGGATWLPADVRVNRYPAGSTNSWAPTVVADGAEVVVVWQDGAGVTPVMDIYTNRSSDGGITWEASDQRLDVGAPAESEMPSVCASGEGLYVAWRDWAGGSGEVVFRRSLDFGGSWLGIQNLGPGSSPALACTGDRVAVAWADGGDIYCNRSANQGQSWLAAAQRLDLGDPAGASLSSDPKLCFNEDRLVAAWSDQRNSSKGMQTDVFANLSADGGASWLGTDLRLSSGTASFVGGLVVVGGGDHVVVGWHDDREGDEDYHLYLAESSNGGASFAAGDQQLPVGTDDGYCDQSINADMLVMGPRLAVVWSDNRSSSCITWDAYFNRGGLGDLIFADDFESGDLTAW